MHPQRRRDAILIAAAPLVLGIGTTAALAAAANSSPPPAAIGPLFSAPVPAQPPTSCASPSLAGTVVDVSLTDMGAMMDPGTMGPGMMMGGPNGQTWPGMDGYNRPGMGMMQITASPRTVPAGQVSLRVFNGGAVAHEALVMPLNANQAVGQRPTDANGEIDETGTLGEASLTCGADGGEGIAPGTMGWTTVTLAPGRYEVLCNIPGHYLAGAYTELDVAPNR